MAKTCPDDGYPIRVKTEFGGAVTETCMNKWHPVVPVCPACGSDTEPEAGHAAFGAPRLAECPDCGREWNPLTENGGA